MVGPYPRSIPDESLACFLKVQTFGLMLMEGALSLMGVYLGILLVILVVGVAYMSSMGIVAQVGALPAFLGTFGVCMAVNVLRSRLERSNGCSDRVGPLHGRRCLPMTGLLLGVEWFGSMLLIAMAFPCLRTIFLFHA